MLPAWINTVVPDRRDDYVTTFASCTQVREDPDFDQLRIRCLFGGKAAIGCIYPAASHLKKFGSLFLPGPISTCIYSD
jgi:hypothetical protein